MRNPVLFLILSGFLSAHAQSYLRITGTGAVLYARGKMMHVCIDACENITLDSIRIENNTFHLREKSAIGAKSTTGLRVTGNRIHAKQPIPDNAWLNTTDCNNLVVEDNR